MPSADLVPVTPRDEALDILRLVAADAPVATLAPYLRSLMTHDHEQAFAIMRGSGNAMSASLQLLTLLEDRGLITMEEVFAAEEARLATGDACGA